MSVSLLAGVWRECVRAGVCGGLCKGVHSKDCMPVLYVHGAHLSFSLSHLKACTSRTML